MKKTGDEKWFEKVDEQMRAMRWYDRNKPRLNELVFVHVDIGAGESFDTLMTRVPGLGEEVDKDDRSYRVTRVRHEPVDDDGRARAGWHAFLEAELVPEFDEADSARVADGW